MLPILHQKHIELVANHDFDGGQNVAEFVLGLRLFTDRSKTQRRGNNNVGGEEVREKLDSFTGDFEADAEVVIAISREELLEVICRRETKRLVTKLKVKSSHNKTHPIWTCQTASSRRRPRTPLQTCSCFLAVMTRIGL